MCIHITISFCKGKTGFAASAKAVAGKLDANPAPPLTAAQPPVSEASTLPAPVPTQYRTATTGLSAEMAMLADVAANRSGPVAFLWQAAEPGLVLPERFARTPGFDDAAAACAAAGWPVGTRKTGGGITPQGPGVLNLALAFRAGTGRARTIRDSYAIICDPLAEALAGLGITTATTPVKGSFCDGDYNLAVGGRKLVGTAQRWRGEACLAHALILTDIALAPAVAAVQQLSDGLGHNARFDPALHCRLADLLDEAGDPATRLSARLWPMLARRGYDEWPGTA